MWMRIGNRDLVAPAAPYVIAEIGVNHDGQVAKARELIVAAADAGADAIKFQYFEVERLLCRGALLAQYQRNAGATDAFSMLKQLEMPLSELAKLSEMVLERGLDPIVTTFSVEHVAQVAAIPWAAYKVASPDLINRPLIEALMAHELPLILSTGASTLEEVKVTLSWLETQDVALMQCVSAYPTPVEAAQLGSIRALQSLGEFPVGYSDHTIEEDTGALAVAAGAVILEKHLTMQRSAVGPDHRMSLEPAQFRRYVEAARRAAVMLGQGGKSILEIEQDVREVARQSIVTTRRLKAGHPLERADITIKRPGVGLPPHYLALVLGRRLRCDVDFDTPLTESHVGFESSVRVYEGEAPHPSLQYEALA